MPETMPKVLLLKYTPVPEEIVAMGAKLCYSDAGIEEIAGGVARRDQASFIKKLVDMGHMSPVEHASFTFGIEGVSRSFLAQVTRHRIASFSVKSQRYVGAVKGEGESFDYIVPPRIKALGPEAVAEYEAQMKMIQGWYNGWVDKLGNNGQDTFEDARFVLPNAAETKMIMTMNARELHHFFEIRCCNRAQWEIRNVAWEMLRLCKQAAPELFSNAGASCVQGPCTEGRMSCGRMEEVRKKTKEMLIDD